MRFLKIKIQKAQIADRNRLRLLDNIPQTPITTTIIIHDTTDVNVTRQTHETHQDHTDLPRTLPEALTTPIPIEPDVVRRSARLQRTTEPGPVFPRIETVSMPAKNIVLNYGKAIASFATSPLAIFYLSPVLEKENTTLSDFVSFVKERKHTIAGIIGLRSLLLVTEKDSERTIIYKKTFQMISEVFIKYFSVNWIIHSRLVFKLVYLKFRHKMLRRVQNPERFTYVKKRTNKDNKKKVE